MRILPFCVVALTIGLFLSGPVLAAPPSIDDIIPAIEGGETQVQQPAKVKVDEKSHVVEAATAQDAVNKAIEQNKKEIKKEGGSNQKAGTTLIRFPSGLGVVATGVATYRVVENPVATRISQRQAAIIAFTEAKKKLAAHLNGLSNEGKDEFRSNLSNVETKDESLTNLGVSSDSTLKQSVEAMLRGFVVYELVDDAKSQTISLSIVTTPRTRGQLARPAPNHIEAETLRDGLKKVLAEVNAGLVPPVGGKVVTIPATGETAFVGFGSSVVRLNENAAVQAKLNLAAQKNASAYAQGSLCGLIIGDQTTWKGEFSNSHKDNHKEFETASQGDPLNPDAEGLKKLDSAREEFVATMHTTEVYQSARSGRIPPGIDIQTWFNDDNTWAYAIAVYIPSATNAATGIRREMDNTKIIQDIRQNAGTEKPVTNNTESRPGKEVKPLPSGKVNDDDL